MKSQSKSGFTLVEMLVVITIIAILATMTAVATKSIAQKRTIKLAEAHMRQVELAILDYKAKLGFFPPDNGNQGDANWVAFPPLFYELTGVVPETAGGVPTGGFRTILGNDTISKNSLGSVFGRVGLANSSEETRKNFFPGLQPFQFREVAIGAHNVKLLVVPAKGPKIFDSDRDRTANPWRYNSSNPTNNPGSFDLWTELEFDGGVVVVGNWKRRQR